MGQPERDHAARLDAEGQGEDAAGDRRGPQGQRDQRGPETDRPRREQQVLHAGVDGPVVRAVGDGRHRHVGHLAAAAQAGDHEHGDLGQVVDLPLHRAQDPGGLRVAAPHPLARPAVQRPGPPVLDLEPLLGGPLGDDHELPVLPVRAGRSFEGELDATADDAEVDRVGPHPAHGALRGHGVDEGHGRQATLDLGQVVGGAEVGVHAASLADRHQPPAPVRSTCAPSTSITWAARRSAPAWVRWMPSSRRTSTGAPAASGRVPA